MKTQHKTILIIVILLFSGVALNRSYASEPAIEKALSMKDIQSLAPLAPIEADFNDNIVNLTFDIQNLAPATPVEADFNDDMDQVADSAALAPTMPSEADFSDSL